MQMYFPYEKQCTRCGLIYESYWPILDEPFVCPHCVRESWKQRKEALVKRRKGVDYGKSQF